MYLGCNIVSHVSDPKNTRFIIILMYMLKITHVSDLVSTTNVFVLAVRYSLQRNEHTITFSESQSVLRLRKRLSGRELFCYKSILDPFVQIPSMPLKPKNKPVTFVLFICS